MNNFPVLQVAVLFTVTFVCWIINFLSRSNPELISGFKWGETDEIRASQREWLVYFHKSVNVAILLTFLGGIVGLILANSVIFCLSMTLPMIIGVLLPMVKSGAGKARLANHPVVWSIALCVISFVFALAAYVCLTDLDTSFHEDTLKISGIYGIELPLNQIKEIKLCENIPEVEYKVNGFAMGSTVIGHFTIRGGAPVTLFLHSGGRCICIQGRDGATYYVNSKKIKTTEELFCRLRLILGK